VEPYLAVSSFSCSCGVDLSFARERERYEDALKAERTEIALLHVTHREQTAKLFDAYREDVAQLCQRIQAPELAVVEHQQGRVREPDSHPLTDEQIAEQQEAAELIARMERVENEGVLS
jgi:hypothetical protein